MKQKKIAVINDLSGYGRCSLTVSLPVISAMKVQCCPVPTSILSNHTGFPCYYIDDYTERMEQYISKWKQLGLEFDGIYIGYLGSAKQIEIVIDFLRYFGKDNTAVIMDPIMGDHGIIYKNFDNETCQKMKRLIGYSTVLTPNITEACMLTDTHYKESGWTGQQLQELADKLHSQGPEKVVITGIHQGSYIANYLSLGLESSKKILRFRHVDEDRPGTGDVFASIIAADTVKGNCLEASIKKASYFIKKCLIRSAELEIPVQNGVCLEEFLTELR